MTSTAHYRPSNILAYSAVQFVLAFWLLVQIIPVIWIYMSSLKPSLDINRHMLLPPRSLYLDNYNFAEISESLGITLGRYLGNSLIVVVLAVAALTVVCFLAGYSIAKVRFRGKNVVIIVLMVLLGIPAHSIVVPLYYLVANMNLLNNYLGVVLPYVALFSPFTILMLQTYFRQFPDELIDAAKIDGQGTIGTFVRVVLPSSLGAVSMVFVINFTGIWNEFLFSLIILKNNWMKTLPVGLMGFKGVYSTEWGPLFAGLVVVLTPSIAVFLLLRKRLLKGIHMGALKG